MPSAPMIVAQAVPELRNAFPGWKLPTHLKAQATIGAVGAPTMVAEQTTPGVVITRTGAGVYSVAFPPCLHAAAFRGNVVPANATVVADHRLVTWSLAADALAKAGLAGFRTIDSVPAFVEPVSGSAIDI